MGLMSRLNIFIVSYHVVKLVRLTQKEAVHIMHAVDNELTGKTSLTIFCVAQVFTYYKKSVPFPPRVYKCTATFEVGM